METRFSVLGPYNVNGMTGELPAKEVNAIRFVCVSDTHNTTDLDTFPEIPDGDVFVHCGDFTQRSLETEFEKFFKFLDHLPHKHKIVIGGNHDVVLNESHYKENLTKLKGQKTEIDTAKMISELKSRCQYLLEESVIIEGIKIFGTPYTSGHSSDWAFWILDSKRYCSLE